MGEKKTCSLPRCLPFFKAWEDFTELEAQSVNKLPKNQKGLEITIAFFPDRHHWFVFSYSYSIKWGARHFVCGRHFSFLESGGLTYLHHQKQCPVILYAQDQADDLPKLFRIIWTTNIAVVRKSNTWDWNSSQSPICDISDKITSRFGCIAEQKLQLYSLCLFRLFFFLVVAYG